MDTMPELLEQAARSDDVEIRRFADDMLHPPSAEPCIPSATERP
jgi:hypothetical protein